MKKYRDEILNNISLWETERKYHLRYVAGAKKRCGIEQDISNTKQQRILAASRSHETSATKITHTIEALYDLLAVAENITESRWGYHICDRKTCQQVTFLKKKFLEALRSQSRWESWWDCKHSNRRGGEPLTSKAFSRFYKFQTISRTEGERKRYDIMASAFIHHEHKTGNLYRVRPIYLDGLHNLRDRYGVSFLNDFFLLDNFEKVKPKKEVCHLRSLKNLDVILPLLELFPEEAWRWK